MPLPESPTGPASLTSVSRGGLAVARRIAAVYRSYPAARAFIVGGSVSRGCADTYSDLEIGVFWEGDIPVAERRDAVARLGGDLWMIDRDGHFMEHFGLYEVEIEGGCFTGSSMISMNHATLADVETALDAALHRCDTDPAHQELLFALQHSVPIYGEAIVADWNARAATFPDELAAAIVRENLTFGPWFIPEAYARRDDPLVLYNHFLVITQHLVRLLLGLNRLYLPSPEFKWLDQTIGRMTIAPVHLSERLRAPFRNPDLLAAWRDLKALLFETLDLVDRYLPMVDTAEARRRWDPLPPYTLMDNVGQGRL